MPPGQCARPLAAYSPERVHASATRPAELPRRPHLRRRPRAPARAVHGGPDRQRGRGSGGAARARRGAREALARGLVSGDAGARGAGRRARARRRPGADALALALVPARQPRRGQRARAAAAPARARARRHAPRRLAARRDPAPRRARHDRRRAARDARRRRAAARHDRPPDRGAAAHDGREARAHLRAPARPRRAPAGARRRGRGAARDRRHDPGAVGLRRGPRRLPHPARRGPRRARLLRLDAAPRGARALPRARGGGRGVLPGRGDRGAAAADVRHVDGRRPRRQPERDRRGDGGGARHDARPAACTCSSRGSSCWPQRVSLSDRLVGRSDELAGALAALAELFPDEAGRGLARNPEEPYRRYFSLVARARARDTRWATRAATSRRASCSPTCGSPSGCCATGTASSSP